MKGRSGRVTSSSTDQTNLKEVRKFGAIAFVFFGCLLSIAIWRGKTLPSYFFGTLCFLGFGLLVLPKQLSPLCKGWNKVGHTLGKGVTMAMMTVAYYFVVTPSAFIKRLFGGRPLPLLPDKNLSSYWVDHTEPAQPKERFLKRF